jgi:tetratricopeptide (TPR) repeat protein
LWLPIRWWLLMALLPWGLAALIKKGKYEVVLWALSFFILFSGTVVLFFVNGRFRIPLWPGLAVIGGGGATYLWSSIKTRHVPRIPIICSIALLFVSTINWFGIPPDPIENDLSMRANAYQDQGRYDEALEDIQACLKIAPNNPRYHFVHGNIQQATGNNEAAISAYFKAIALDPTDPMFHNNLGISFENIGNPDHAVTAYQKALELRSNHRAAKSNLLLLSIQTGQLDRARTLIKQMSPKDLQNATLQCAAEILTYKETGNPEALRHAKTIHPALTDQLTAP